MGVHDWIRKYAWERGRRTESRDDDGEVLWSALRQYAHVVAEFTTTPPVALPHHSFTRLGLADLSTLPAHQTITAADGCQLAYRYYAAQGPTKTIVILIHGAAGYSGQLHVLAHEIASRGKGQVYTLDMRGHGLSPGRRGHAVTYAAQMCDDIAQFIRLVDRKAPYAHIVLGGHSAGGGLVLRTSRTAVGRRLSGYLLLAPYLGLGSPPIKPLFGGWVKVHVSRLTAVTLANLFGIKQFNNTTVVTFGLSNCPNPELYTPSWSFNTLLAMGPGLWEPTAMAINSNKRVLVIAGNQDECFYADKYAEAFQSIAAHAEIRTVEGVGHWDVMVDPVAIAGMVAWLSKFEAN